MGNPPYPYKNRTGQSWSDFQVESRVIIYFLENLFKTSNLFHSHLSRFQISIIVWMLWMLHLKRQDFSPPIIYLLQQKLNYSHKYNSSPIWSDQELSQTKENHAGQFFPWEMRWINELHGVNKRTKLILILLILHYIGNTADRLEEKQRSITPYAVIEQNRKEKFIYEKKRITHTGPWAVKSVGGQVSRFLMWNLKLPKTANSRVGPRPCSPSELVHLHL